MHAIAESLQGAYAFILIFQIVVVTLLFLTLLALVIRRLRRSQVDEESAVGEGSYLDANAVAELGALKEKIASLQSDPEGVKAIHDENKTLSEKIRFLESKLLEYEILQEEIGTLSALKIENEKLRSELQAHRNPSKKEPLPTPLRVVEGGQVESPADALLREISSLTDEPAQGNSGPSS